MVGKSKIKRVKLNSKTRKGYFYRTKTDSGRVRYLKTKSKHIAQIRTEVLELKLKNFKEKIKEVVEETEICTLHYRLDYTREARTGHEFLMADSSVSAEFSSKESDERVIEKLTELFQDAFKEEFGNPLLSSLEMTSGLERNTGRETKVEILYKHGKQGKFKRFTKNIGEIADSTADRKRFFESIKRK